MRFHILLFHNTYLSVFYDVPKEQKKNAHSLWAYFRFRIAYKLLAIYRAFTIKNIHLLHVLQIMPEKPSASGMAAFFCNIDAGFDGKELRSAMFSHSIIPNVCPNPRNGGEAKEDWLYDEEMYKGRWKIERTNAWMVSKLSLTASTSPSPVGKVGTFLHLSWFSLKIFTNQISLDNFIFSRKKAATMK